MRILLVSMDFPPTVGGIAAHVYELARALVARGQEVAVLTRAQRGAARPERVDGIRIFELRLRLAKPFYGWQIERALSRTVAAFQPALIHVHGLGPLKSYRRRPVPLVYTNHTSGYLQRVARASRRQQALLARLFDLPDLFLAPSQELLATPCPIRAAKRYIPNGVDAARYRHDPAARLRLRAELGFADADRVAILTRRLVAKNGVIHLANAAALVEDPRFRLLLIGDGPEAAAIRAVLEQGFAGRYRMLGALTHEAILPYYSAADVAILPSLMEATSISGLEAMACCLPLVGTRVGGIPDLIEEGVTGWLCAPAEPAALAQAISLALAADLSAFGQKARARVEAKFAWPEIARQTLAAYRTVLPAPA